MTQQRTLVRTVGAVMTRNPVAVSPSTRFKDIVELFAERGISAVPVVSATGAIVGVVSEADLLRNRHRAIRGRRRQRAKNSDIGRLTAGELMSSPAVTVRSDATLAEAAGKLATSGLRRLFVVDDDRLVGVLARRDVLSVFRRSDQEICAEIEREVFERQIMAPAQLVRVSVDGGVVLLTGQLPWRSDIETAISLIAEIPGVIDVKNRLVCVFDDRRHKLR
jgi:CBS domain-containing protein